jgi:sugar/nucleoside kinase (ribokinase family)
MKKPPVSTDAAPLALGTGLVALDVVVTEGDAASPRYWAGGTCGNVLIALAYLGWRSAPVARLRGGDATTRLLSDLGRWGVSTEFISLGEDGSTPVIVERIGHTRRGELFHTFSWRCPKCGSRLPGYKPVLAANAEAVADRQESPRVFFFDRLSRGAIVLAQACADRGAAIVFEPSAVGNPALFREAWELAHVVKYSHERLHELPADLEGRTGPNLQIETLGQEGLRYRTQLPGCRARAWQRLDSLPAVRMRDTAGAGDWCTAGLIHRLYSAQAGAQQAANDKSVREAIRYGQALAAWTCGFEGARGGMYEVDRRQFDEQVAAILGAGSAQAPETVGRPSAAEDAVGCLCPSCEEPEPVATWQRRTGTRSEH